MKDVGHIPLNCRCGFLLSWYHCHCCCRDRSKNQKNFQLIIISHDQAFVDVMSRSGYAECYYKVSKGVGYVRSKYMYMHTAANVYIYLL